MNVIKRTETVVLVALNLIIILAVELVGGGHFFAQSGFIHVIALMFIMLAAARAFSKFGLHDPILKSFLKNCLAAMAVFGFAHLVEALSEKVLNLPDDAVYFNLVNFYLISLLLVISGVETIMRARGSSGPWLRYVPRVLSVVFVLVSVFVVIKPNLISLDLSTPLPYVYLGPLLAIACYSTYMLVRLGRLMSFLREFANYLIAGTLLIVIASVPILLINLLQVQLRTNEDQLINIYHFTFFWALSAMVLAFGRLTSIGGVYADIRQQENPAKPEPKTIA